MSTQDFVKAPPEDLPGADLVWTKLRPPAARAGLVRRADLAALVQAGVQGKLCLLAAPAGFGKTTLLLQWRAAAERSRVAWVSLDQGDSDPIRFWVYVDLDRTVLPSLLNELSAVGARLFLVLDDYYLVTNSTCHQMFTFFLDHLPVGVHVVLSTRADPPLPLARMRAKGELAEIRVAELRFTSGEASALPLNASMGLRLATDDVERLVERTEGWAAGLYLGGLSL